jgi:hypothetical protein
MAHPGGERLWRVVKARDLGAFVGGGHYERQQAAVDADPAALIAIDAGGMQVGGLHIQTHPPASGPLADGGEQYLRPILGEHPPQPAGVIMYGHQPDAGQDN